MNTFFFTLNDIINNKFHVRFQLKSTISSQSYRVNLKGNKMPLFLKIFLDKRNFDIEKILSLEHSNLILVKEIDRIFIKNKSYYYIVTEFNGNENLGKKISRGAIFSLTDTVTIITGILNLVKYLHKKENRYLPHLNINDVFIVPIKHHYFIKISGVENSHIISNKEHIQHDIATVGRILFHIMTGNELIDHSDFKLPNNVNIKMENIILRAISAPHFLPFNDVDEFIQEIYLEREHYNVYKNIQLNELKNKKEHIIENKEIGFKTIAGMDELKSIIKRDIIDALNQKEKYKKYGLTIPNGMLLYGPPGCGKTFFAEKMAEEINATFYQLKPSDIQSKWVNASQEKVK